MQTTTISQHLLDLSTVDPKIRAKSTKLLSKICDNILSNPAEPKYHDLNFEKIHKKLKHCPTAISLLYDTGFKLSNDGLRLKWVHNDSNSDLLLQLSQNLHRFTDIPPESDYNGSTSHKIRKLCILFNRIKSPNDLSSNITNYTELMQQLRAQHNNTQAANLLIQNLMQHTEAMQFVHALESAAKYDLQVYEGMDAFKKVLKLWSVADIMKDLNPSPDSSAACAKLEELIIKMKRLIELCLSLNEILQFDESESNIKIEVKVGVQKDMISNVQNSEENDERKDNEDNFVDELLSVVPGIDRDTLNGFGNMEDLLAAVDEDDDDASRDDKDSNSLFPESFDHDSNSRTSDDVKKHETDLELASQLAVLIMSHSNDSK